MRSGDPQEHTTCVVAAPSQRESWWRCRVRQEEKVRAFSPLRKSSDAAGGSWQEQWRWGGGEGR